MSRYSSRSFPPSIAGVSQNPEGGISIDGELSVGDENNPYESTFGGGDSHTRGMLVYQNTNGEAGTWSDITSDTNTNNASGVNLFPGLGVGNTVYVGADYAYLGLKSICLTALDIGAGSIEQEYWNGSAWVAFNLMVTDASAPYGAYAETPLERVNTEQIRFGEMTGWATKALDGETKYWARYRITGAITTSPVVDQFKFHTSRTEINADGYIEFFGGSLQRRELVSHQRLTDDLQGASPANTTIPFSANISITPVDNNFQNGANDGVGQILKIPDGLDTSRPLVYTVGWTPLSSGAGDVELEVTHSIAAPGDILDGSIADTVAATVTSISAQDDELQESEFELSVPTAVPGNVLAVALRRDATAGNLDDTYASNVRIVFIRLEGYFWR